MVSGVAAVAVPPIAAAHGLHGAVLFVAVLSGVMAVLAALWAAESPRPGASPGLARAPCAS